MLTSYCEEGFLYIKAAAMPFVKENIFTYRTVYDKQNKLSEKFTLTLRFCYKKILRRIF